VDWRAVVERENGRFEGARGDVLRGNAAYGAALARLMAGERDEAARWFREAAVAWRASWEIGRAHV